MLCADLRQDLFEEHINSVGGEYLMANRVGIVIPAYEPDERFLTLLRDLDAENMGPIYAVDDGSGPDYAAIFEAAAPLIEKSGGTLLRHEVNRGKGRALKTAFDYILKNEPEMLAAVTADSDGQHTLSLIHISAADGRYR